MANEITHNFVTGSTLYFCCFQQDGDVFLTGGASDEVWGTGGRTAADYDEAMTEEASSGHYKGSMAAGIGAGVYQVVVFLQAGGAPADADVALAQGEIYWDGSAEINLYTIESDLDVLVSDISVADSNIDTIASDLVVVDSNLDTVVSDVNYIIDLEKIQYNDFPETSDDDQNSTSWSRTQRRGDSTRPGPAVTTTTVDTARRPTTGIHGGSGC